MFCVEGFLEQDLAYQEQVLPKAHRRRIAIEAASTHYWYKFVGLDGAVIGIDQFGASAPINALYDFFEITVENIIKTILKLGEHS